MSTSLIKLINVIFFNVNAKMNDELQKIQNFCYSLIAAMKIDMK